MRRGNAVDRTGENERAWTGLDHESALRLEGRRYRPGKVCDRPQESERQSAGKPIDAHGRKGTAGSSVVVDGNEARPGRAVAACKGGSRTQADGGEG